MTRYTNVGWKRTYFQAQASFDPNDDQIASNTASTSVLGPPHDAAAKASPAPYESNIDTPAESNHKRRRKSKANSERGVVVDSVPAAIANDADKASSSVTNSARTKTRKKVLAAKLKEKARRAKSAFFFLINVGDDDAHTTSLQPLQTEPLRLKRGG